MTVLRICVLLVSFSPAWSFAQTTSPHVVMLIAEGEYDTDQSLPRFARDHLRGYRSTLVLEDPQDRNRMIGIEAVESADVLVISVRRRTLPAEQLDVIRRYVAAARPVIGIRTASHAFHLRRQQPPQGRAVWPEFDQTVFGGNYTNHFGNALKATVTPKRVAERPALSPEQQQVVKRLMRGLESIDAFVAGGSLYRVTPLADRTTVLLTGRIQGEPPQPVAWTFVRADGGNSFYTSLGHVDDFAGPVLPRLLRNAIDWACDAR